MVSRLLVFVSALLLCSPSIARPEDLSRAASTTVDPASPGQDLLITPPSDACGPASSAPCPPPGETQGDTRSAPTAAGPGAAKSISVGSPAKAFKLQDLDGKAYAFSPEAASKPTLVIFWSLFCAPCKEEFPFYGRLAEEYGPKGLDVIAVNLDSNLEATRRVRTAKSYLKMLKVSLRVVLDRKEGNRFLAADPYGVTGTPSLFLVDKAGTVRWLHVGRVEPEQLRAAIGQVLEK